ncbi:MAG: nitroreductase family protein [archaeon]
MPVEKLMEKRMSIRKYSSRPIDFNKIAEICNVARLTPCASNIPTVKIVIIADKDKIKEITQATQQPFVGGARTIILVCSDLKNLKRIHGEEGISIYSRQQAGAAIQNMLLKITELGLASCWVGWFDKNAIKRICKIPDNIQIEAVLPLAHPLNKKAKPKKKIGLKEICFYEKWNQKEKKIEKLSGN